MRGLGVFVAMMALAAPAASGAASAPDAGVAFDPRPVSPAVYGMSGPEFEARQFTYLDAGEGVRLYLEWWLPQARPGGPPVPARHPTVLQVSPYEYPDALCCNSRLMAEAVVPRGYGFARLHVRGSGASGGCIELHTRREAEDVGLAVEWLATKAPWSDGNVGAMGLSYDAMSVLHAAARADRGRMRHLKALVTAGPAAGWGEYTAPWGVPFALDKPVDQLAYADWGVSPGWGIQTAPGYPEEFVAAKTEPGGVPAPDKLAQRAGCRPEGLLDAADVSGDFTPFARERELRLHIDRIETPTLMLHGTADRNVLAYAQSGLFDRLRGVKAGVFGPWGHEFPFRGNATNPGWTAGSILDQAVAWFDRHLKGQGSTRWPAVQVQGTDGQWRTEREWPATGGPKAQLALSRDGRLGAPPRGSSAFDEGGWIDHDPATEDGPHLAWTSEPLAGRLEVSGTATLDLWLRTDRSDAHLAALLETLDAGGEEIPGGWTVGMRSLRHLDPSPRGFLEQEHGHAADTTRPVHVALRFAPTDLVVPAGGRVRVRLGGGVNLAGFSDAAVVGDHRPTLPSGGRAHVEVLHDCATRVSTLRFRLPWEGSQLLNLREDDEVELPRGQPRTVPRSDAGGLARRRPCGPPGGALGGALGG
jgi:predicted acyl esterase